MFHFVAYQVINFAITESISKRGLGWAEAFSIWPRVLLAAKTYANHPLKPAVIVDFTLLRAEAAFFGKNRA